MKRKQKRSALIFLPLVLGIVISAFLATPAAPLDTAQTTIVSLSEGKDADVNQGFFRASAESQEARADDFVLMYSLQGYHSNSFRVRAIQANGIHNLRPQKVCLYLLNSCFTI